jgi:hypothetical protein
LLPPVELAWVVVGARLSFAVALCAYVNNRFGVVMACQVSRRIGTCRAELDPHLPPQRAKQRTLFVVTATVRRRNTYELTLIGLVEVAFGIVGWDRGHCITRNRLFPIDGENREIEAPDSIVRG